MRILLSFVTALLMLLPARPLPAQPAAPDDALAASVDSLFQAMHRDSGLSGVLLLAHRGKVTYQAALGYADPRTRRPLTIDAAFNLASVSKQFTTMCAMILKERRRLDYDARVRSYLPDFPYDTITVRHLMTHTSGLPEYFELYEKHFPKDRIFTNRDMLDLFIAHRPPLDFRPGEQFRYSNTGYLVLAMVIEAAAGEPFAGFLTRNVIRPLGLPNTYPYNLTMDAAPGNRVFGFRREADSLVLDDLYNIDGVIGDGNVYASAPDLQRWSQALYRNRLVKKKTLREAFTPFTLNDGKKSYYGFGWGLTEDGSRVSHTGGWVGFLTYIQRDLKGPYELIVLTNSGFRPMRRLIGEINGLIDGARGEGRNR